MLILLNSWVKKMINLKYLCCFSFILLSYNVNANFSGKWCWDKNSNISYFSLVINKHSNKYSGGYYSVAQYGNRIDDNDFAFSFLEKNKNVIKTKIKSGITGNIGLIKIHLIGNNEMIVNVLTAPKGDFFFPKKSKLYRCK